MSVSQSTRNLALFDKVMLYFIFPGKIINLNFEELFQKTLNEDIEREICPFVVKEHISIDEFG